MLQTNRNVLDSLFFERDFFFFNRSPRREDKGVCRYVALLAESTTPKFRLNWEIILHYYTTWNSSDQIIHLNKKNKGHVLSASGSTRTSYAATTDVYKSSACVSNVMIPLCYTIYIIYTYAHFGYGRVREFWAVRRVNNWDRTDDRFCQHGKHPAHNFSPLFSYTYT